MINEVIISSILLAWSGISSCAWDWKLKDRWVSFKKFLDDGSFANSGSPDYHEWLFNVVLFLLIEKCEVVLCVIEDIIWFFNQKTRNEIVKYITNFWMVFNILEMFSLYIGFYFVIIVFQFCIERFHCII